MKIFSFFDSIISFIILFSKLFLESQHRTLVSVMLIH